MPRLQLKYIAGEFGTDLMDFDPGNAGFMLNVELGIGESGKNSSDVYSLNVCDEKGLLNQVLRQDVEYAEKRISSLAAYKLFVMKEYDYETLLLYVDGIVKSIPENLSRKQKGLLLSQYFDWDHFQDTIDSLG